MGNRKIASRQHAPKFVQDLHRNECTFYTQSRNKELFSVFFFSLCWCLVPWTKKEFSLAHQSPLRNADTVWTLPYGRGGGPDEGSDFAFLNLAIFLTVRIRDWPHFRMFWVTELTEFGSDFQLQLLQNNDCNSQNLDQIFLTQETQQIGVRRVTCVSHSTFSPDFTIPTYFLKNPTMSLDTEKDFANIKKEKSPWFKKMKS